MILARIKDALAAGDADRYRSALPELDRWLELEPATAAPAVLELVDDILQSGGSTQAVAAVLVRLAEATVGCAVEVPVEPLERLLETLPDDAYTARIALAAMITRVHPAGIMVPKLDRLILASEAVLQSGPAGGGAGERLGRLAREIWLNLGLGEPADLAALAAELAERHGWALATVRVMAEMMPELVRRRPDTADTMLGVLDALARGNVARTATSSGPSPSAILEQVEAARRRAVNTARLNELARAAEAAIVSMRQQRTDAASAGDRAPQRSSGDAAATPGGEDSGSNEDESRIPIERLVSHLLSGDGEPPRMGPDALAAMSGIPSCELVRALEGVLDQLTESPGGGRRLGRALDYYVNAAGARPDCARATLIESWLERDCMQDPERRCTAFGVLGVVSPDSILDSYLAEFLALCGEHSSPPRTWIAVARADPGAMLMLVNALLTLPVDGDARLRADLLDALVAAAAARPDIREEALARLCDSQDAAAAPLTSAVSDAIRRLRSAGRGSHA